MDDDDDDDEDDDDDDGNIRKLGALRILCNWGNVR